MDAAGAAVPSMDKCPPFAPVASTAGDGTLEVSAPSDPASDPGEPLLTASRRSRGLLTYLLTALSALSYLLFGYDAAVVSGALLLVRRQLRLSDLWHELLVSASVGAAGVSALVGGPLADRLGRKPVILTGASLFMAGSLTMATAGGRVTLLVGRLVLGLAIGLSSTTVPIYISEAAPAEARGLLVTACTCVGTLGTLVAALTCGALSGVQEGWRWMLGLGALPAALQLTGFAFMPESPRFLMAKGREERAWRALRRIRGEGVSVREEFSAIKADLAAQQALLSEKAAAGEGGSVLARVARDPPTRRALIVGCCLHVFQQTSAVNTVIYYSASIITMAGVRDASTAIWLSSVVNLLSLLSKLVGLALVERAGRRQILLWSTLGSAAALLLLGAGFQLSVAQSAAVSLPGPAACRAATCDACQQHDACGFCFRDLVGGPAYGSCVALVSSYNSSAATGRCADPAALGVGGLTWAADWCPTDPAWLPITAMFLYITLFSPGLGAMPWTITSEIFPLWARSTCNAVATAVNWFCNLLVSLTFLTLMAAITRHGAYYLFCGCTVVGWAWFFMTVPETKAVPLEKVPQLFSRPWGPHAPTPPDDD